MAVDSSSVTLAPKIRTLLGSLRTRVRAYIVLDSVLSLWNWWLLTFWAFLALDYTPVLLWASELPRGLRSVLLLAVMVGYVWIVVRHLVGRLAVPLADRSLALVVERRFPQFHDSLITAVELCQAPGGSYSLEMLSATHAVAAQQIDVVKLARMFRWRPLLAKAIAALCLTLPWLAAATLHGRLIDLGVKRLYLLSDETWPRAAHIEVAGVQVEYVSAKTSERTYSELLPFRNGQVNVARGANVALFVRASLDAERVPEVCRIYYRTEDGMSGHVSMRRQGAPRDRFQYFSYAEKPLRGILGNLRFDVIGHDHRVRGYRIQVVETPAVVETVLDCQFPDYLVDASRGLWLPRQMPYRSSGVSLPRGTRLVVRMRTNKPLRWAEMSVVGSGESRVVQEFSDTSRQMLEYEIPSLEETLALDVVLRDTDDVMSETPHRVLLSAVDDKPPQVDVAVRGIGSAVTPQVVIPVEGQIQDDYSVGEAWFEFQQNQESPQRHSITVAQDGKVEASLDFRQLRINQPELTLQPGQKLFVTVKAQDRCNLGSGPNVSQAERLELEVVTPEELLIRLDRRELAERRRLEHVLEELTQTRDSLIRVQNEIRGVTPAADPRESVEADGQLTPEHSPPDGPSARMDLRAIRTQQALRQCQKSASEVLGIASAFYAIREELMNNRIDAEDRKSRLKEKIADPLEKIGKESFAQWESKLVGLEKAIGLKQNEDAAAEEAIVGANQLIVQLNQVLEAILDIESYNELIEIVRNLIQEQERILSETQKARKQQALELLK